MHRDSVLGKDKLLIVDDSEMSRAMLYKMFHERYVILEAANGREALRWLRTEFESIDAVLLDIVMPVMDGFDTLLVMKEEGMLGKIPVILVTSDSSSESVQRGFELGVADVIVKPYVIDVVRRRVFNIIEQYAYRKNLETILNRQAYHLRNQTEVIRVQAEELQKNSNQMIDMLSAVIEFKNMESVAHIHNIRFLTKALLHKLVRTTDRYPLDDNAVEIISVAAAMHDIGKITVPDVILNKPGRLTVEEFEVIKEHTTKGCEILERLQGTGGIRNFSYCYDICRHHHERWDGRGYPDGLKQDEISIWAQAVSVADAYDALTSKRVYKDAYASKVALEMILNGECGAFNPLLLDCLKELEPKIVQDASGHKHLPERAEDDPEAVVGDRRKDRLLHLMQDEQHRNAAIAEVTGEITMVYTAQDDKAVFSDQFEKTFGISGTFYNASATLPLSGVYIDADPACVQRFRGMMDWRQPVIRHNVCMMTAAGTVEWFEQVMRTHWDESDPPRLLEVYGRLTNVSYLKKEADAWRKKAERDSLTGLYNREAFERMVEKQCSGNLRSAGLMFIDLDNFKLVNDTLGHPFGDHILKHTASMLLSNLRAHDIVARWGGDEFVVWVRDESDGRALLEMARRLCRSLEMVERSGEYEVKISSSIGISQYPKDSTQYRVLLEYADHALHAVKRSGKAGAVLFEPWMSGVPM